jgi:5-methylcytosine-specific restriction endonuclease McrA
MSYKLTIELVPETSFYNNVRSAVTQSEWDVIRKKCYKRAGHKCEICGDKGTNQGKNYSVECHEIWEYDDNTHIQTLKGLIALCPQCHQVKHVGFARMNGKEPEVIRQLMKVNKITSTEADNYIIDSFKVWEKRSEKQWTVDISYLDLYKKEDNTEELFRPNSLF